jgi:hypothetical protein
MEIKQGIPKERINEVLKWSYEFFNKLMNGNEFKWYLKDVTNWDKSILLLNENNEIKGVYLFGDNQLLHERFENLKGIEGVLLAIDKDIRGQGWGDKLKEYPKTLGVDYIWGQQLKGLNNLNDWLKRRELIGENEEVYITVEIYKNK